VFVVATDQANAEIVYFANFVALGEDFTVSELFAGVGVPNNLNITVYSSSGQETPVQTISFASSCPTNQPLFLQNRFGSMQLIAFTNENQGIVDSIIDVTLVYTVDSVFATATIQSLQSITTSGFFDLTDQVEGVVLEEANDYSYVVEQPFPVDLSMAVMINVSGTVEVALPDGFFCLDTDVVSYTVVV
jgi:hypothetical protein